MQDLARKAHQSVSTPCLDVCQGEPVGSVSLTIGVVWLKWVKEDMASAEASEASHAAARIAWWFQRPVPRWEAHRLQTISSPPNSETVPTWQPPASLAIHQCDKNECILLGWKRSRSGYCYWSFIAYLGVNSCQIEFSDGSRSRLPSLCSKFNNFWGSDPSKAPQNQSLQNSATEFH